MVLLLVVLGFAVTRPRGWPEVVVAVPAAVLLVAIRAISLPYAEAELTRLAPVVGFLAAVLVLAQLCDDEGLFRDAGALMARACRGRPRRLLVLVFVTASAITAVLSLDATVVLLTPVVFATAVQVGARPKPHAYACTHLANTASLLLPVSNLTNLLAFAASGLSFTRFAALMALPWIAAIATEYLVFRRFFATDLGAGASVLPTPARPREPTEPEVPVFVLVVVACTLAGFGLTSLAGINPAWAAFAGALVLAVRALAQHRTTPTGILRAANVPFLAFVLALAIVVRAVVDNGLAGTVRHLIPAGATLPALLGTAAVAAVLANVINNLPAVLVLLPLAAVAGPGLVLATLIGVNIGPNLTYVGSLATLLWRRVLHEHDTEPDLGEFTRLGLLTVPTALIVAVLGLWAALHLIGG
ncbi:arsenical pump membrane protein [Amycolatopsis thermophila]|uniref:Arsenical pump membrane protein n=1 Tax=Amycolatopsis thermophila TaxID=206084 RepID=A0ABU0ERD9_9PSEU|nr:arsenical pump membrane protein [Amycolatopsis thermophila]